VEPRPWPSIPPTEGSRFATFAHGGRCICCGSRDVGEGGLTGDYRGRIVVFYTTVLKIGTSAGEPFIVDALGSTSPISPWCLRTFPSDFGSNSLRFGGITGFVFWCASY
jgi:hypothetical protein